MLMAADVSALARMMGRRNLCSSSTEEKGNEAELKTENDAVTQDLLGGIAPLGVTKELDLDLKTPTGWEKRLHLSSGEVVLHRNTAEAKSRKGDGGLQDLNFPPQAPILNLELKLFPLTSSSSSSPPSFPPVDYQSVCTLDKVKSALSRLKQPVNASTSPTTSSTTSASAKRRLDEEDGDGESGSTLEEVDPPAGSGGGAMVAAGCSSCLSYVLVPNSNPRCPRCGAVVPMAVKKCRLDLNLAAVGGGVEG